MVTKCLTDVLQVSDPWITSQWHGQFQFEKCGIQALPRPRRLWFLRAGLSSLICLQNVIEHPWCDLHKNGNDELTVCVCPWGEKQLLSAVPDAQMVVTLKRLVCILLNTKTAWNLCCFQENKQSNLTNATICLPFFFFFQISNPNNFSLTLSCVFPRVDWNFMLLNVIAIKVH